VGCILLQSFTLAMPPKPGIKMPPWLERERLELGIDNPKDPIRDAGKKGMFNGFENGYNLLVSGTQEFPVVLIEYPDLASQYTIEEFYAMLFGGWPSGSANDYYTEISYGKLNLDGWVAGWAVAANSMSYYGENSGSTGAAELVWEAAEQADEVLDYSELDNDGDGFVDCFTTVHSGHGAEETGDNDQIWSHKAKLSDFLGSPYITNDPDPYHPGEFIKIDLYTIQPELYDKSNYFDMVCIGVFCHEWGHAFGLPDLYDTDQGDGNEGAGLGKWCLMAGGSWGGDGESPWSPAHMSSWCKSQVGWLIPTKVTANKYYTVKQVETNPQAYKLWTNGNPQKEYFLIENRQAVGFDENIPASGLLICHIDENVISARRPDNQVNAGGDYPYGVAVEQADGVDDLWDGNNSGDDGDLFPSSTDNTAFEYVGTSPDSRSNSGNFTFCGVNEIPVSASEMSPYMYVKTSSLEEVTPVSVVKNLECRPNPFSYSARISYTLLKPTHVTLTIWDATGRCIRTLVDENQTQGLHSVQWKRTDDREQFVPNGVFFSRFKTNEYTILKKIVVIR